MPRGIPNKTNVAAQRDPAVIPSVPLILIQPGLDGVQFTAYGLNVPEIVEALRLALVHIVGKANGAIIDEHVARPTCVLSVAAVPFKPGKSPVASKPKAKRETFLADDDDDGLTI